MQVRHVAELFTPPLGLLDPPSHVSVARDHVAIVNTAAFYLAGQTAHLLPICLFLKTKNQEPRPSSASVSAARCVDPLLSARLARASFVPYASWNATSTVCARPFPYDQGPSST